MTSNINETEVLSAMDQINVLSDPKRLEILRMLMVKPWTISQIGRELDEYPAAIRYHIQRLVDSGLVELSELRASRGYIEKFYIAKVQAIILQSVILPKSAHPQIVFMGSHDLALEILTAKFEENEPKLQILNLPIGSLDGLIALRQGAASFSGCHLFDPDSKKYNTPYIKHFFPDQNMKMITLAHRTQGLIFANGNPKRITRVDDLAREDISFVNRNQGSGTRLWLDNELRNMGLDLKSINGYTQELCSHTGIAKFIKSGRADVGIGLIAAADMDGLDYLPLFQERYDLVIPEYQFATSEMQTMIDFLTTRNFRRSLNYLAGYTTANTGELLEI